MPLDANAILIVLCGLIVLSYLFNYVSVAAKIPSVLLLIGSGIGIKYAAGYLGFSVPPTKVLLEILGITGLIFIVLEAALDLKLERKKVKLIGKSFASALALLGVTAALLAWLISVYFNTSYALALVHAIPLSVISSAIAIPSVRNIEENKKEFVVYESTFSDVLGIISFNFILNNFVTNAPGANWGLMSQFVGDMVVIIVISVVSTFSLIFLLNHAKSNVRFFLTFAILVLAYGLAKMLHLPSLILVLFFGLGLNNYHLANYPLVHKYLSFNRLNEVTREMKLMTGETAFIIRTFFFLLFGYSLDLSLLASMEVLAMGAIVILITLVLRAAFLRFILSIKSTPLTFLAPRGLITILLFYSIPQQYRLLDLSDGVLFLVIVVTSLMMPLGLLWQKKSGETANDAVENQQG